MSRIAPGASLWPIVGDPGEDEGALWLRWLVRLRWVAIAAQFVTLSFSFSVLASPLLVVPLGAVIGALALANLRALQLLASRERISEENLLAQLALDVLALTSFFSVAGGPENPFTILYVIHVAMAAIMLPVRYALGLTGIVVGCYALLHVWHLPLHLEHHSLEVTTLVIIGRFTSFAIASISVAAFVVGLATSLRRRSRQLLEARDRTARTDRLRSVGTLAAGAAHELNTPLSTIGLRVRRVARRHGDEETTRDLDVVLQQLDRCKSVVEQLLVGAGDPSASGIERKTMGALVREAVQLWEKGTPLAVKLTDRSEGFEVELPRVAFTQALINLLENAREAQEEAGRDEPIEVRLERGGDRVVVCIRDHGVGLPDAGSDRVGDPFFTTKPTGTGLGVFVARSVAEGAGGGLSYAAGTGGGTEARWWFPEATRRSA
jgi:two-component system sensor histidine kinase RegB